MRSTLVGSYCIKRIFTMLATRNTGQKKKLKSILHFPEVLDMAKYLRHESKNISCIYDIKAVLIHRGTGTQSGHYFAHIKEDEVAIYLKNY